jgi:hypothetical protein
VTPQPEFLLGHNNIADLSQPNTKRSKQIQQSILRACSVPRIYTSITTSSPSNGDGVVISVRIDKHLHRHQMEVNSTPYKRS